MPSPMQICRDISRVPDALKGAVIAIGNFDGLHLGHRAVLAEAKRVASELNAPCAALTFYPHPREFFQPALTPLSIDAFRTKAQLMHHAGMNALMVAPFTQALATRSAESFVQEILISTLHARHVVTGEHFAFGAGRTGNAAFLKAASARYGFGYSAVAGVDAEGAPCSSTRIREFLRAGDMAGAHALLGRPYHITGRVTHGDGRGKQLGFPTANITPANLFLPAYGVYAVRVQIDDGWGQVAPAPTAARADLRGENIDGIANLGTRPTVGGESPRLEVHCFDFNGDLYGKRLTVEFKTRLREERKFDSLDALKAQITLDSERARTLP